MKKNSFVTGYPLKQSSPAAIEKALIERVRDDLGEFHDMVLITPILKIDSEDGDLSGNVTNAYGVIVVKVINKAFTIPFIIQNKELLPFDVIRMGQEEVAYDMSKLRKLVVQLDKVQRESHSDDSMQSVVSIHDVPTQNGFLGTIMSVRDNAALLDTTHPGQYTGDNFGIMDDERAQKLADTSELFELFHEKLASIQILTEEFVKTTADKIEQKFTKQAEQEISHHNEPLTKTAAYVRRQIDMLQADKLVDASIAHSGNNIVFPVRSGTTFEKRLGRVYNNIESVSSSLKTNVNSIVIDSRGEFAFLKPDNKFMILDQSPPHFKMRTVVAAGLEQSRLYTLEKNTETVYAPFLLKHRYVEELEGTFIVSSPAFLQDDNTLKLSSSRLIRDLYVAEQTFPTEGPGRSNVNNMILVVVLKESKEGFTRTSYKATEDLINTEEVTSEGLYIAKQALERMVVHFISIDDTDDIVVYTVGEYYNGFFPLTTKIEGHFTKSEGYFEEGLAFEKSAGYKDANRVRLLVESQNPPRYSLEWSYIVNTTEDDLNYDNVQHRKKNGLSPDQAKGLLTELGFDEVTKERFFQITQQNGRMAEFRLPSVELAAQVMPEDKGRNKAIEFVKTMVNESLNARNFIPLMQGSLTEDLTDLAKIPINTEAGAQIREKLYGTLSKEADRSYENAVAFEKLAESFRGKTWLSAAQLFHVKHYLDKLSLETTQHFVKESESVWELIPSFEPAIEKVAKELILYNREQHLKLAAPFVEEEIIKEGLQQLDGLSRYASLAKQLGKLNFFRESPSLLNELKALDGVHNQLQMARKDEVNQLIDSLAKLRSAERMNVDAHTRAPLEQVVEMQYKKTQDMLEEIKTNRYEYGRLKGEMSSLNRKKLMGAALPVSATFGVAAGAIGTE